MRRQAVIVDAARTSVGRSRQGGGPGRMAWLASGYPEHEPATTIDRKCGSSQHRRLRMQIVLDPTLNGTVIRLDGALRTAPR